MGELLELAPASREPLHRAFSEELYRRAPDRAAELGEVLSGSFDELYEALARACRGDQTAATAWAAAAVQQASAAGLSCSQVVAGLDLLASLMRRRLIEQAARSLELSSLVGQLEEAFTLLRRTYIDIWSTGREEADAQRRPFVALVEHMSDFACLTNLRGKPFYINEAGRRLVGLGSTDLAETALRDFLTQETWQLLRDIALPTVQRTGHWSGTGQVRRLTTGEVIDVEMLWFLIRDPHHHKPLCLATVLRDVDEHRRVERALRDSEALYSSLVESLPLNVFRKDREGRFTFGNTRYCQTLKRPLEELLGKTDFDLFPAKLAEKYVRDDRTVLETGEPFEDIEEHQLPDGTKRYVQVWKTPVYDYKQQIIGVQGIFWDVTEQKRAEEALQESEARKAAILQSALDAIITVDHQGKICEFNQAAERTFQRSRREVIGKEPGRVLFPDDPQGHHNRIDRYLSAGSGSMLGRRVEVTAVRADGQTFPAEMAMTISRMHGLPVFTFFLRDISDRKQAEDARARHAAELARSNADLQQFAYAASHDLQEPLRKIQAFGDRLKAKCGDQLSDLGRDYLERMQSAAGRMQELIRGLLELSRVTTKGQSFAAVDLAETARQVVSDLEVQIAERQGSVDIGPLPTIEADPLQMRQLLQNLIGNALKFHPADVPPRVTIRHEWAEPEPSSNGGEGLPQVRLLVEDRGIGFDEKHLERIFAVFQRLHTRDQYEGAGLGLAICRKIVERHGGSIAASSLPGRGATFIVTLPTRQTG